MNPIDAPEGGTFPVHTTDNEIAAALGKEIVEKLATRWCTDAYPEAYPLLIPDGPAYRFDIYDHVLFEGRDENKAVCDVLYSPTATQVFVYFGRGVFEWKGDPRKANI